MTRIVKPNLGIPHRFESLQVFRALAALSVVIFHTACFIRERTGVSMNGLMPGCSGVDFFFVLSGFIIFTVHGRDIGHSHRLGHFAYRRFIRVYPLYAILSVFTVALYLFHFGHYTKLNFEVLTKSFFLFPQRAGIRPILNPGWTLSHEALFYLLFAFIIYAKRRARSICLSAFAALTLVNCVISLPGPYWVNTWLFSPYNLEFAAGCMAGMLATRKARWTLPFGAAGLAISWALNVRFALPLGDGSAVFMVCFFGLPYSLIVLGAASSEYVRKPHVPRILVVLGDATYSIYLTHFMCASALCSLFARLPLAPPLIALFITLISVLFGYAVYRVIEAPMLSWMKTFEHHLSRPITVTWESAATQIPEA